MKNDFNELPNRKNTNCLKWDLTDSEYPLWVADMDFKVAPEIAEAVQKRASHEVYGYGIIPDDYYEAYINWWDSNYNVKFKKEDMKFASGVVPAIGAIIRRLTKKDDKILIQTPVYHVFFYVIEDNGREVIENRLVYKNNSYSIDFDDLDEKLAESRMMILCNPHNPIGKIWSKDDLKKMGELCKKHDVILIADEIHCDLTDPNIKYNPFILSSDWNKTITCISPSKSFNIAGLQSSVVHSTNEELLKEVKNQLDLEFTSHSNIFAVEAVKAAYNESADWLAHLKEVIYSNKILVDNFLKNEIPDLKLVECDATYLLWIDISDLNTNSKELCDFLKKETGIFLSPGIQFGENGNQFFRMNIACPEKHLKEALKNLKKGIDLFKSNPF